jgi:lipid II:glycine glycyltransferase (peptidoglycan interpeptide bridge formation enzyme)
MEIKKLIDNVEALPFFAHPSYLASIAGAYDYGYLTENQIILPYVLVDNKGFKRMVFPIEILGEVDLSEQKDFLNRLPQFVKKNFDVMYAHTSNTAVFATYPDDSKHCKFGSYIVDITKDEETLFAEFNTKHRNGVRRAIKEGVTVKHGDDQKNRVLSLITETYSRQGMASETSNPAFLRGLENMGDHVSFWMAEDQEGKPQGAAIFMWSTGNTSYYLHGGSSSHPITGSMNLLIWEAMKYMANHDVKIFDFVGARVTTEPGSKLEGIQRFKKNFGSTMKVGNAFDITINKPQRFLFNTLIRIKCFISGVKPVYSIIDQEIAKGNV